MEEDSIDSSESFISLSSISKRPQDESTGEQQELKQEDDHEEEKEVTEQNDGRPKVEDKEAGEESSCGGIVSQLISKLTISVPGLSSGDEPEKEQNKEEKDSDSAGLISHLLPKLSVALPGHSTLIHFVLFEEISWFFPPPF